MIFALEKNWLNRYVHGLSFLNAEASNRVLIKIAADLYQVSGKTAIIKISGILSNNVSFFDQIFGFAPSLTYDEIIQAIDKANQDESIKDILLDINSPGGYVEGAELAALSVAASVKPVYAQTSGMMASAAYWIGSQAKKIKALSRTASFGSIGVATVAFKEPGIYEIASTDAPNKRPDPETEDGMSAIKKELDDIHKIFASDVARGRGINIEKVNSDFGKGGVFLAEEAKTAGMIDSIPDVVGADSMAKNQIGEKKNMEITLEKIKAENPDIAATLREEGIQAERKRVSTLSKWRGMGPETDKIADEAILSGKDYNDVNSELQRAALKIQSGKSDGENAPQINTTQIATSSLSAEDKEAAKLFGLTESEYSETLKEAK
jgi:ClpP class serine protease